MELAVVGNADCLARGVGADDLIDAQDERFVRDFPFLDHTGQETISPQKHLQRVRVRLLFVHDVQNELGH